ncbi:lysozyme inhibitor LprI family protein [Pseudomonas sp. Eth.TT006]
MYIKGRYLVSACALLFFQQAMANGMDCEKAASAVENAVCADKRLYALDVQMGSAYRELMKISGEGQPELKRTQRLWLKARNQCDADIACLEQSYRDRLKLLQSQQMDAMAHRPTGIDQQVVEDLQRSIQKASEGGNREVAVERVLASLIIDSGETSFSGDVDNDNPSELTHFPATIPKDVSADEWKALTATGIDAAAETGQTAYSLLDMDGDGQRDLIVQTYAGGTGMFTYVETWRRDGDRFVKRSPEPESALFYTNDRGANQSVYWIKARGNIYVAYRNGAYGVDHIYLLNPLEINREVPTVTVRYRYSLNVPSTQHKDDGTSTFELQPDLRLTLNQAITKANEAQTDRVNTQHTPLCPIPATGAGENDYYSYGPVHYSVEDVFDLSVFIGNDCYIGKLVDWFGSYDEKKGLFAQLALRRPDTDAEGRSYEVNARRQVIEVSTSIGKADGGAVN